MKNIKEKVEKLVEGAEVSFIASVDEKEFPNMKAMLMPRKRAGLREFWFSTNTSSMRVGQFRKNPKASIYFYDKGRVRYQGVMLVGEMEVLENQKIKDGLWRLGDRMYYHKGKTDPDYCVLKFRAKWGRYYSDLGTESFEI